MRAIHITPVMALCFSAMKCLPCFGATIPAPTADDVRYLYSVFTPGIANTGRSSGNQVAKTDYLYASYLASVNAEVAKRPFVTADVSQIITYPDCSDCGNIVFAKERVEYDFLVLTAADKPVTVGIKAFGLLNSSGSSAPASLAFDVTGPTDLSVLPRGPEVEASFGGMKRFSYDNSFRIMSNEFYTVNLEVVASSNSMTDDTFAKAFLDPYIEVLGLDESDYQLILSPGVGNESFDISVVPIPSSAPMFGAALLGLAGLGYAAKRSKATPAA